MGVVALSSRQPNAVPSAAAEPGRLLDLTGGADAIGRREFAVRHQLAGHSLLSLEALSRDHAGVVNGQRSLLHKLANADPNAAVRRLAILALKNGSPHADTLVLLEHIADSDDEDRELRQTAAKVADTLRRKARARK